MLKRSLCIPGCMLLLVLTFCPVRAQAQGCSDAGVCTAGAMHNDQQPGVRESPAASSEFGLSASLGSGEQSSWISGLQFEYQHRFSEKLQMEVKVPLNFASGDIGSHFGIGDPVLTLSRFWNPGGDWSFSATAGTRVSLTDASATEDDRPLPMPYQNGLGTFDLLGGLSVLYRNWLFLSTGYQQPVIHYNRNGYIAGQFPAAGPEYNAYFSSKDLRRKGDLILRAEGTVAVKRLRLSGGPLAIYHLGDDWYRNEYGGTETATGSQGLTLNLTAKATWAIRHSITELIVAAPVIVRDYRPDGLTRHWVLTLRYRWK